VLPIALGEATKLSGRMLDADKAYDFTIRFGEETDTLDGEGKGRGYVGVRPTLPQAEAVLERFTGAIEQVPPAYSALKVDGRRAYDLARAGEDVVLAGRSVTVHGSCCAPAKAGAQGWVPAFAGTRWRNHPLRPGVQGTYIRSLRARHRQALGTVGACHHVAAGEGGAVQAGGRDIAGQIAPIRYGRAP
jgi:tRNA pseudouridine55 synthase